MNPLPASLVVRPFEAGDIANMAAIFGDVGEERPESRYERYLAEQTAGTRDVLVAFLHGALAGYLTIVWESSYPPFRERNIPEIVDVRLSSEYNRRKRQARIALFRRAEQRIGHRAPIVGIGARAKTHDTYRLSRRGYVHDGGGVWTDTRPREYGYPAPSEGGIIAYFTKTLS